MELVREYVLSEYQEMGVLNKNENVRLVRHSITGKIAVKKTMKVGQKPVYAFLKTHKSDFIPEIYECFEDGRQLIVIEEYIEGRNLDDILSERSFSPEEGCCIIKEICRALETLHTAEPPIICRDLKPENIMMTSRNEVKLIDFDIARVISPGKSRDTVVMGTEGYAAPEQFGHRQTDGRTDIYALGTILNCLILRKLPVDEIVEGKLGKVIRRCIALNPDERYQNVKELEMALEKIYPSVSKEKSGSKRDIPCDRPPLPGNMDRERKTWRRYLPPGFRSGTAWKKILAVMGYLALIDLSLSMEIKEEEKVITGARAVTQQILFLLSQLAEIGFVFNYIGLGDRLPILKSENRLFRVLKYIILDFILIAIAVIFWMLLDDIFW